MKTLKISFSFFLLFFLGALLTVPNYSLAAEEKTAQKEERGINAETAKENPLSVKKESAVKAENAPMQASQPEIPAFSWGSYFQAIGIMLFLLLIFWYVLKIVKKVGNGRFLPNQKLLPKDSMYLEGQLPLGPGKTLVVVRVLNERLVLGITEKNINLLTKTGMYHEETFDELMQKAPLEDDSHA